MRNIAKTRFSDLSPAQNRILNELRLHGPLKGTVLDARAETIDALLSADLIEPFYQISDKGKALLKKAAGRAGRA